MDDFHMCPKFESAFEFLGKRWTGLIIRSLLSGSKRFSELQEIIPTLSSRVLTERFKELEDKIDKFTGIFEVRGIGDEN